MMRRLLLILACALLAPATGLAASMTLAWDASAGATGYKLLYGTASGTYTVALDVGAATQVTVPALLPGTTYYFAAEAYNASGTSLPSLEVSGAAPGGADPNCAFPLGADSVSIFPVGKINFSNGSGSTGVAGSRAYLLFQVASPGSPVTHISIQTGGQDLSPVDNLRATGPGDQIAAIGSAWFTVPAGSGSTWPLSIFASNAYGCARTQATGLTLQVK